MNFIFVAEDGSFQEKFSVDDDNVTKALYYAEKSWGMGDVFIEDLEGEFKFFGTINEDGLMDLFWVSTCINNNEPEGEPVTFI